MSRLHPVGYKCLCFLLPYTLLGMAGCAAKLEPLACLDYRFGDKVELTGGYNTGRTGYVLRMTTRGEPCYRQYEVLDERLHGRSMLTSGGEMRLISRRPR